MQKGNRRKGSAQGGKYFPCVWSIDTKEPEEFRVSMEANSIQRSLLQYMPGLGKSIYKDWQQNETYL